jgi:histidinol-phosphate/aromatic aminotransferase/cobyric acid decarboxylase-like protein
LVVRANPNNPDAAVRTREFFQAILRSIPPIKCVDRKPIEIVQ